MPLLLKLLLPLGQRASSNIFDHLFVRLPSLCSGFCSLCTLFSTHFSVVHSVVFLCGARADIHLLFQLLAIKEYILKALEVFLCFETKRNETVSRSYRSPLSWPAVLSRRSRNKVLTVEAEEAMGRAAAKTLFRQNF